MLSDMIYGDGHTITNRGSSVFFLSHGKEDVDAELTAYKTDVVEVNKMSSSENLSAT